ncbi:MAG TPA: Ig-like domain repeat protein [Acidimicrobiales bacterium]|nr:Ig-like domain repeat protein [Acidimicrobiales bacterium]
MRAPTEFRCTGEGGDTLIELLIAILIIALTVTALLSGLVTAISSTSEHQSLATLDTVLSGFSESVQSEVQSEQYPVVVNGQPQTQTGLFTNCQPNPGGTGAGWSPYRVVSTPTPSAAGVGDGVTVFVAGFTPNAPLTVKVAGVDATPAGLAADSQGNKAVTFTVPALPPGTAGAQPVVISDGSSAPTPSTTLDVLGSRIGRGSPIGGYTVEVNNVAQWDAQASTWVGLGGGSCPQSGVQRVTTEAVAPDGTTATSEVVVLGTAKTTVQVTSTPVGLGATLVFQAQVIPPTSTTGYPTGTVTWQVSGPPDLVNAPCPQPSGLTDSTGNTAVATCSIQDAWAGDYTATASYTGNYQAGSSTGSGSVNPAAPSVMVTPPSHPVAGNPATFTVRVMGPQGNDPTPAGTQPAPIQWSVTVNGTASTCTSTTPLAGSGSTATATCTFSQLQPAQYAVTAEFSGDGNYLPASGTGSLAASKNTPTVTIAVSPPPPPNPRPGVEFQFVVTVSGTGPTPGGSITSWNISVPAGASPQNCGPTPLSNGQASCTIADPSVGTYGVQVQYGGDTYYLAEPGSGSATVATLPPAGVSIGAAPNPTDGAPDTSRPGQPGDQIVYTYNQAMNPGSILTGWTGSATAVTAQFTRRNGQSTVLTICTTANCTTALGLGTVFLGDSSNNAYMNPGTITLNATITMSGNGSVFTVTLLSNSAGLSPLFPSTLPTKLAWTPSAQATSTSTDAPCSTTQVSESTGTRNF